MIKEKSLIINGKVL